MEAKRLLCPQCQNSHVTYDGRSEPRSPDEAAQMVIAYRHRYGVDRMAISGGEPTLNRKWLHACVFVLKDSDGIEKWGGLREKSPHSESLYFETAFSWLAKYLHLSWFKSGPRHFNVEIFLINHGYFC